MKIIGIGILAFLLYWLQQVLYRKWWNKSLYVTLRFEESSMFEGEEGSLYEVIENRKRLPLPMLKVKFQTSRNLEFADIKGSRVTDFFYRNDVFEIGGGEKITRTLRFTGKKRGYYKINGIDLVGADLFLSCELLESRESGQYVYVYPKPYRGREFMLSLKQLNGEVLTKRHLLTDPFEYKGIREYQPYDDIRMVNWKATARMEELMVNEKNYTALKAVRIFLNIEDTGILKKEEAVEAAIRIAAGAAEYFLKQGMSVECCGNGRDVLDGGCMRLPAGAGMAQMTEIYKKTARIDTGEDALSFADCFGETLLRDGAGSMTVFVAPNAYEDFVKLVTEYDARGGEFIWFYPVMEKEKEKVALPGNLERNIRVIPVRN